MSTTFRIATFNVENLDDPSVPPLAERIAVMRPQLERLRPDVLCLQEVHGQEQPGQPRRLLALEQLLTGTQIAGYYQESTQTLNHPQVYDKRNLVILSRFPIVDRKQIKHEYVSAPAYKKVTADPEEAAADEVTWERPILYVKTTLPDGSVLHVINLHLKSKIPSKIPGQGGQQSDNYAWKSVPGWAEGYFLSSLKRVGQALEARVLIDSVFDEAEDAQIAVCGDFNADLDAVPVKAIRGDVEETANGALATRVLVPCEHTIPEPSRFSLYHHGKGQMLDHLLVSRSLLSSYRGSEIHNELLHDESIAFARDTQFPESDHAPVVAEFVKPDD
ncbi:MAG: endonuclease/exonuclease/phosphatase family protein [Pirellulales bacterium]|nr:endonuclease/exonuclease/phosphatase family protein [Pirellulales bacterium]